MIGVSMRVTPNRLMGKLVAIGLGPGYMRGNCLPLWVDQGDGGVVGSTKD